MTKKSAEAQEPVKKKPGLLRGLLRALAVLLGLALILGAAVFAYGQYTKTHYTIRFYQETSKKVSENLRIAVISDIHDREYGENNELLLADLRALKPDLILFAGDMVIRERDDYRAALSLVTAAAEIAPCYGVLGNHESERIYSGGDRELPAAFERAGLKLLRNAMEDVPVGRDTVRLIGVEGTEAGFEEYGGRAFMEQTEPDPSSYCIVMAHIPILFRSQLSAYDFDLGIAGHTHGGIAVLPVLGGLYSSEEGFFPTFSAGEYVLDRQQTLIVSAGLGDSAALPVPMRFNNMPELVVIDVNRY